MQFAPCVVWSRNIQSETIKRWPTLLLCMQFWHFWWGPSVQDSKQCGLANCDECENWIQTSSHSSTRIRFSWWLLVSDDVADFMCAWRSRGWYCDGKAWCRCIVFRSEEFDASYQDWRPTSWTGWGALDVTDCKALDNQEVIGIETCQRKTTCADTKGECTPHWSWVDWRWAPKTEGTGGGTHFNGGFGSMEGSLMAACMFFVSVGRQGGTQRHFWTMVWSMATRYFGGIFDFPMTESDLSVDTSVESSIFRWLRAIFLSILVNDPAECPTTDRDDGLREALLPDEEIHENALPSAPVAQKAVLLCPLPGQVHHLKWWLTKYFADHVDIFHQYPEMGNDERTEMELTFQDSCNSSVFVTAPRVGSTGQNLTAANHAVITQKLWVFNEQWRAFARVVQLGQNRVPHTWLLNTGPGGYDNRASDLLQQSGVAQMNVLHSFMSQPNIMTLMIFRILEPR